MIRTRMNTIMFAAVAAAALLAAALFAAQPASAVQTSQVITCNDGHTYTIRPNTNNGINNWSSPQLIEGGTGHLTPVAFYGELTDTTVDEVLYQFSQPKGGKAHGQQQTITCGFEQVGTVADFADPGAQLPPGVSLTDDARFDFTAVAVHTG